MPPPEVHGPRWLALAAECPDGRDAAAHCPKHGLPHVHVLAVDDKTIVCGPRRALRPGERTTDAQRYVDLLGCTAR